MSYVEQMCGDKISDYSFAIGENGQPIVRSINTNEQLKAQSIQPGESVKASSIEEVETITIIRAKGSHFLWVKIGERLTKLNLPHED